MKILKIIGDFFKKLFAPPAQSFPKGIEFAAEYLLVNPKGKFGNPRYIAEIDYSKKSSERRLALWDRVENKISYFKVSHGSGTGKKPHNGYCVEFSNTEGSHMTCLGAFKTAETYNGSNGYSMRLDGLDPTNSRARMRAIVMHGSDYVKESNSSICGRSWGCPSVDHAVTKELIDKLKMGSLLLAHYNGHFEYTSKPRPASLFDKSTTAEKPQEPTSGPTKSLFPYQAWTEHLEKKIKSSGLLDLQVHDSWFKSSLENWVHLFAAMCKYESSFQASKEYLESFKNSKGERVVSTGLFQLSYESSRGYGFGGITTSDLKNPFTNIDVAVAIMAKWVAKDGYIAGSGKSPYVGGARYWAVLRSAGKLSSVKTTYEGLAK